MLGRFLILGQYLTISGETKKLVISLYLLIHDLSTTSRNNIQHNAKIKIVAIIIALLFPNLKILLNQTFSYDFPKIRNIPKIFLRSSENVAQVLAMLTLSAICCFQGVLPTLKQH